MLIAEGDAVVLFSVAGRVLDQGNVLAVSPDRRRALIRWTAPGGLRRAEWCELSERIRRHHTRAVA